jgi:hypothetical protein
MPDQAVRSYDELQTEGDLALLMDISPGRSSFG